MLIETLPASPDQPSPVRQVEGCLIGSGIAIMIGIGYSLTGVYANAAPYSTAYVILLVGAVLARAGGFSAYQLLKDHA